MISIKNLIVTAFFALLILPFSFAQTADLTIQQQLDEIVKSSGTFKEYKVIPISKVNNFKASLRDSVLTANTQITNLKARIDSQQAKIAELTGNIEALTTDLEKSNELNESITFLGVPIKKTAYNIMVWSGIFALIGGLIFVYFMYNRSNKITRKTQREFSELTSEFAHYKAKSQEKQVKLKRDLQTAINTLTEKGVRV